VNRYTLRPRAQKDIDAIWDFSAETWDGKQADAYILQIKRAIETIAADPLRGRVRDDIRKGYRTFPVGAHVLFYTMTRDGVQIIRILHQRMDFTRHV
jgi:toxin ParE1/3/4